MADVNLADASPRDLQSYVTTIPGKDAFRGPRRFVLQTWGGGSFCDMNGRPRRLQVEFRCSPVGEEKIDYVQEVDICAYKMAIQTYKLCEDPAFSGELFVQPVKIRCHPVVSDEDYERAKHEAKTSMQAALDGPTIIAPDPRDDPEKVAELEAALKAEEELLNQKRKMSSMATKKTDEDGAKDKKTSDDIVGDSLLKTVADRLAQMMGVINENEQPLDIAELLDSPVQVLFVDENGVVQRQTMNKKTLAEQEKRKDASKRKREGLGEDHKDEQRTKFEEKLLDKQEKLRQVMDQFFGVKAKNAEDTDQSDTNANLDQSEEEVHEEL